MTALAATREAPAAADGEGVVRRCIVTGERRDRARLLRFVVGPDGEIVPDVRERLPGRGIWLAADRQALDDACRKRLFAKAARCAVHVPAELPERIEHLLVKRCGELIGLALRSGQATFGAERVREWLAMGKGGLLLQAADGAPAELRRMAGVAGGLPAVTVLTATEIGAAVGRERIVHGLLSAGPLAEQLRCEAGRLAGFRGASETMTAGPTRRSHVQRQ